jgi:rhodanese-related sulfurtransferase
MTTAGRSAILRSSNINRSATTMPTTAKQLVDAANAVVPKISGKEAQEMVANGAVLVDIRDSAELSQTGKAASAVHIPRGSLEFKADLSSPTAEKSLAFDKPVILHCASGGRAALAGKLLKEMGYQKVYNLGGFKDWVEAGGKVDK